MFQTSLFQTSKNDVLKKIVQVSALLLISCLILPGCLDSTGSENSETGSSLETGISLIKAEPQAGSILTHPPRALRLFFDQAPDAQVSDIRLSGPAGDVPLMGLHTMGMNDLMITVNQPQLENGTYQVFWKTNSYGNTQPEEGSYSFTIAEK